MGSDFSLREKFFEDTPLVLASLHVVFPFRK